MTAGSDFDIRKTVALNDSVIYMVCKDELEA